MVSIGFRWTGSAAKQDITAVKAPPSRRSGVNVLWEKPPAKIASLAQLPESTALPPGSTTLNLSARQQRLWLARGEAFGRMFKRFSTKYP